MMYFERIIGNTFKDLECRYFTKPEADDCICIEVYGDSRKLGISDGQWDIYNELYERFSIVDWKFNQHKNKACCLTLIIKKPKRLTRFTNCLGDILWVDNKDGLQYEGEKGLDELLSKLNEEI